MASWNPATRSGAARWTGTQSGQQRPGAQPEPGRPVQLVQLDKEGHLTLDEGALSRCLEQGGVGNAPVCLVSIIGEQRRGKSFLMNCLLRRLQSPNQEHVALGGLECRAGTATLTKGVWMWGQPLWVQAQGRKVAVFLVDTEGCLDLHPEPPKPHSHVTCLWLPPCRTKSGEHRLRDRLEAQGLMGNVVP
ncbi:elongation factor Tu [Platysternon megacephalum]|uniref:Elongation factor Tu n=1 Tax=Platysternon megacephalum TaxID=55544 RepID=A0A4D9DFM6_9SAUR|nr:elongation factor Tu [Platysternon megacephalum]